MSLPPPPVAPSLKSPIGMNRAQKSEFNFSLPNQQQIEERLVKTREAFARIGQFKALAPQMTQSPAYVFLPTNSSFHNEGIVIVPRIENDGKFELPPPPDLPDIRSSSHLPPSK